MEELNIEEIFTKIAPVIKEAGLMLKTEYLNNPSYSYTIKSKGEIVTKADKIAEEIIISNIKKLFPDHAILSEETGQNDKNSDYLWIVDPLDGTTNFAMKNPFFNTTVSLVYKNEIVLGLVYAPIFEEFYYAIKGKGAFLNSNPLAISEILSFEQGLHAFCYGPGDEARSQAADYYKKSLLAGLQTRQLGAAALELARISAGTLSSMVIPNANPWDIAAGVLVVTEAGGIVTDIEGKKFDINKQNGIIAGANEEIINKVLKLL